MTTHIDRADRAVTAAQVERIEARVQSADYERVTGRPAQVRRWDADLPVRWTPTVRASSAAKAAAKKHAPRLSSALALGSVPSTTSAIQAIYTDAYDGPDDDDGPDSDGDDSGSQSSRFAALMADAATWAPLIITAVSNAPAGTVSADPDAVAASVAQDAAVSADAAGTLDTADTNGNRVRVTPESGDACAQCQDAAGVYDPADLDDTNTPPLHKGCQCEVSEVQA